MTGDADVSFLKRFGIDQFRLSKAWFLYQPVLFDLDEFPHFSAQTLT